MAGGKLRRTPHADGGADWHLRLSHASGYASAEDLCDAFDDDWADAPVVADGTSARSRPVRHAVRLADIEDPEEGRPPRRRGRLGCDTAGGSRRGQSRVASEARAAEGAELAAPACPKRRPAMPAGADRLDSTASSDGGFAIRDVHPAGEGEIVVVVLTLPPPPDAENSGKSAAQGGGGKRVKVPILVEQYAELAPRVGAITPEAAEAILAAGRLCAAVRRGMRLLEYGDQSERRLAFKLSAKGYDRALAAEAAAYLAAHGYIHEDDTACLRAEQGLRKLWGPRRIRDDLRANGFSPEAIEEAMETLLGDLDEETLTENCAEVIRRRYHGVPEDRAGRQKLTAALIRLGYDNDTVRSAMRLLLRKG